MLTPRIQLLSQLHTLATLEQLDRVSDLFDCLVHTRWNFSLSTFGDSFRARHNARRYHLRQLLKLG